MICVYCQLAEATTKDHVPPKLLYRWSLFKNLLTVPSCNDCNNKFSKDEEYFRLVIIGLLCHTDEAEELFDSKISRSMDHQPSKEDLMFRALKTSTDGVYLDRSDPRLHSVAIKIACGLQALFAQSLYPVTATFRAHFAEMPASVDSNNSFAPDFQFSAVGETGWRFTFFNSVTFTVLVREA